MKWLVTAFEPFGGAASNSSLIVANRLKQMDWNGEVEFFTPVPCRFEGAWEAVRAAVKPHHQGVLALGQAESRTRLSLERAGLNWIDARMADNAGRTPAQGRIENGEDLLWSPIPWDQLPESAEIERSYSAGTYVCNSLLYQMLNWSSQQARSAGSSNTIVTQERNQNERRTLCGFVHIPLLQSQAEPAFANYGARMADETAVQAMVRILKFLTELKA
jgi:pyroglutamyl-peptidase